MKKRIVSILIAAMISSLSLSTVVHASEGVDNSSDAAPVTSEIESVPESDSDLDITSPEESDEALPSTEDAHITDSIDATSQHTTESQLDESQDSTSSTEDSDAAKTNETDTKETESTDTPPDEDSTIEEDSEGNESEDEPTLVELTETQTTKHCNINIVYTKQFLPEMTADSDETSIELFSSFQMTYGCDYNDLLDNIDNTDITSILNKVSLPDTATHSLDIHATISPDGKVTINSVEELPPEEVVTQSLIQVETDSPEEITDITIDLETISDQLETLSEEDIRKALEGIDIQSILQSSPIAIILSRNA